MPWNIQLPKENEENAISVCCGRVAQLLGGGIIAVKGACFTSPRALSAAWLQYLSKNVIALELGRSRAARIISLEMCHGERLKEFSLVQYKKRLCNKSVEVFAAINKPPGMIWEQKNHRKKKLLRMAEYNTYPVKTHNTQQTRCSSGEAWGQTMDCIKLH